MFIITGQQGDVHSLGNNANPHIQVDSDEFGNVTYYSHTGRGSWNAPLGRYQSAARAAEVVSEIVAAFHKYKRWLEIRQAIKTAEGIRKLDAITPNRYTLPEV